MLPDVEGQDWAQAVGDGVVGTGALQDLKGPVLRGGEPDPAGAEEGEAFLLEFSLEGFEGAPLGVDPAGEITGRSR